MTPPQSEKENALAGTASAVVERGGFLAQLQRRHVFQVLVIYIAVAFAATEILLTVAETLNLPDWVQTLAVVLFIAGIPVAAFMSWALEWTSTGIRVEVRSLRGGIALSSAAALLVGISAALFLTVKEGTAPAKPERRNVFTDAVASVAVFPFRDKDSEGLLLGSAFAEELVLRLGRHADLYVVSASSTSSSRLAGMEMPAKAATLHADYLVTGSIETEGPNYRANIEIQSAAGDTLWSDDLLFSAGDDSLARVQQRLTHEISELAGSALPVAATCRPSSHLEALELYHRARFKLNQRDPDNIEHAVDLLKRALVLDSEYARAWEALAVAYSRSQNHNPAIYRPMAGDTARRALDLCPTLGMAYKIWVPANAGIDNVAIEQELEWLDAIAMEPNALYTVNQYAHHLSRHGRNQRACQLHQRNYRNDPLQPRTVMDAASCQSDPVRAHALADRALELGAESCNYIAFRYIRALYGGHREKLEASIELATNGHEECRHVFMVDNPLQLFDAMHADPATRRDLLGKIRSEYLPDSANAAMILGIMLADYDLAFEALEIARINDEFIHFPAWWDDNPQLKGFRSDPRFSATVTELGFVDYWQEFGWPDGRCSPQGSGVVCQ